MIHHKRGDRVHQNPWSEKERKVEVDASQEQGHHHILYNKRFDLLVCAARAVDKPSGLGYSSEVSHFQWFVWNCGRTYATAARGGTPDESRRIEALWESGA